MDNKRIVTDADRLSRHLLGVEDLLLDSIRGTPLADLGADLAQVVAGGKRLRARLVLRVAPAVGTDACTALAVAAAVELVHSASLLHDDVIDGGHLRRSLPAFWTRHGISASILVGDLLLCQAYDLLRRHAPAEVLYSLVEHTREMCLAEVEQELVGRGQPVSWAEAERIARRKTGALFAFAAHAAAGARGPLADALREAGYLAGTAYQLSDDWLDHAGDPERAGKTLGRDRSRGKHTVAALCADDPQTIRRRLEELRECAERRVSDWPEALDAWRTFWNRDLQPALAANTSNALPPTGGR